MKINWEPVINAAIALIALAVGAYIIPVLRKKLGAEKYEELKFWAGEAVKAAEQIFGGTGRGAEKLSYVRRFLQLKNLWEDDAEHEVMVEASVRELNQPNTLIEEEIVEVYDGR
jgi:hypothetical protein